MKTVEFCSRPPREVVNWKESESDTGKTLLLSTSSGGRELKELYQILLLQKFCRPPREVVNWKIFFYLFIGSCICRPPREVVNWKIFCHRTTEFADTVDLLGRSWIERYLAGIAKLLFIVDLFERSWIERIPVRWQIWAACCRPSRKVGNWNGLLFVSIFKSSDVTSREERVSRNYIPQCLY